METGIELIAKEREEQITKHDITIALDVIYNSKMQLPVAAIKLADPWPDVPNYNAPHGWSDEIWDKMISKPYKERLIIAGALIAAEIDRLQNTGRTN